MAKKNKTVLPKRIAGVKVPKALRSAGGLGALLASPVATALLVDAGEAILAKQSKKGSTARKLAKKFSASGEGATHQAGAAPAALAYALSEAARAFMAALKEHETQQEGTTWTPRTEAAATSELPHPPPKPAKKKPATTEPTDFKH